MSKSRLLMTFRIALIEVVDMIIGVCYCGRWKILSILPQ